MATIAPRPLPESEQTAQGTLTSAAYRGRGEEARSDRGAPPRVRAAGLGGEIADPRVARLVAGLLARQPLDRVHSRQRPGPRLHTRGRLAGRARPPTGPGELATRCRRGRPTPRTSPTSRAGASTPSRAAAAAAASSRPGSTPTGRPTAGRSRTSAREPLRVGSKVLATQVIRKPDWSPDGKEIAFARSDGIHVVTLAGAERQVATTVGEPTSPLWSFDGTRIAYTSAERVFVAAADGASKPRQVAGRTDSLGPIAWAPAGDLLAFTADGNADGRLADPDRANHGARAGRRGRGRRSRPATRTGTSLPTPQRAASCPGHSGIRLYDSTMLSGTCTVHGHGGRRRDRGHAARGRRDPRRRGQRQGARERRPHRPCGLRLRSRHGLGRPHGPARHCEIVHR